MNFTIKESKGNGYYYFLAYSERDEIIGKLSIDIKDAEYGRFSELCVGTKIAKVVLVWTALNYCGKGVATSLLNRALETFSEWNLYLNVCPLWRTGENIKYRYVAGLKDFYSKFGFEKVNDVCVPTMFKKAKIIYGKK